MVMAKGVEDCAFYRFSRLTSLNEVGGDPDQFALEPARFHELMAERQRDWPSAMTTTTTHDTKRSEDTRARIAVLAEVPDLWADSLDRLLELAPLPDRGFGSLLWQAVLGAWPASRERLHSYAEKAMREAGDHTTWTDPDEAYEAAVHAAVDAAFDSAEVRSVLDDLMAATESAGRSNGLALKLLALTVPGVPDVYQGTELWDHSLADPDNRRPVDFDGGRGCSPTGRAIPSCWSRRPRCGCAATGPSSSRRTPPCPCAGTPPSTCSPSTAAARSPSSPGCPSGWRAGWLG